MEHWTFCFHCSVHNLCIVDILKFLTMDEFVTRTMFCKHCHAHDRPKQGQIFVVWGHDRRMLFIRQAHQDGICGYTPHIISYQNPIQIVEGTVAIECACGIHGCGITVGDKRPNGSYDILFNRIEKLRLPPSDFHSLINNWRRSGYELI